MGMPESASIAILGRWCSLSILLLMTPAVRASPPVPTRDPERVWMFVDPFVVSAEARQGWRATVPAVTKEPRSPLMRETEVWEVRWDNTYPTTRWDAAMHKYRMWYGSCVSCAKPPIPGK